MRSTYSGCAGDLPPNECEGAIHIIAGGLRMEKIRKVCGMLSIKNFLLLTVAGIVNAFGVVIFLAPVTLYDSGISFFAMLVSQLKVSVIRWF